MIGAIKRRWKSKKAKVLHKGSELSTSSDSCPASRGFVDGCEDFDKMLKPPSPRQIHPVLEKGEVKYSPNLPPHPLGHSHQIHSCTSNGKKSSTLPHNTEDGCPFIRVNSGRIELVSSSREPVSGSGPPGRCLAGAHRHHHRLSPPSPSSQPMNENDRLHRLGGRLRNDARHSWCGSAFRDGQTNRTKCSTSGLVLSADQQQNNQAALPPSAQEPNGNLGTAEDVYSTTAEEQEILRLKTSLLQERLDVIENITRNCQSWQSEEKSEYERCMADLASQVSKAVSLQQLMKAEVEKLQQRVLELESNNRAMATMVIPTLMKLQETVVGKEGGAQEKVGESFDTDNQPTPTFPKPSSNTTSPKQRKPDCRIPTRLNNVRPGRVFCNATSKLGHKETLSSTASSSPEPPKPHANGVASKVTPNSSPSHRRLSPFATSKSESSSPNGGSSGSKLPPHKSSTYSGIPRMASPRPKLTSAEAPRKPSSSSLPPASGAARSRSAKTDSRLPVMRKNLQNPKQFTPGPLSSPLLVGVLPKASTKGVTGKDEGYSTMSSEALAEQESLGTSLSRTGEKVIEKFNSLTASGPKALHKSNTFSTFRESVGSQSNSPGSSPQKQLIRAGETFTSLPKASNRTYVTASNVRIIRGVPGSYEIELDANNAYEEPSTSTVLWEDSDDSDILFLPLEMSSGASSPSTLVPESLRSSAQSTTTETLTSMSEGRAHNGNSARRNRGEELVALLAQVPDNDDLEERALIEKWMRLEDVRNQVQVDDEWAWDWDGVERTHKFTRRQQEDTYQTEPWLSADADTKPTSNSQIDTSTWTKSSKRGKKVSSFDTEKELELENLSRESEAKPLISPELQILIPEQSGEAEASQNADAAAGASPPPVIEFTPEFYRLVKYGSSGSVNDNELVGPKQQPGSGPCKIVIPPRPAVPRMTSQSSSSSSDDFSTGAEANGGRMDDKISQTDFGSSLENLSISSELFTECRNCLELVKRLVGGIDEACNGGASSGSDCHSSTTLDREREQEREEMRTDHGSSTTWVSLPKGLPTEEVNRIFEILSSSESEDVLSPGK